MGDRMRERKPLWQSLRGILSALACASLPILATFRPETRAKAGPDL